MLETEDMLGIIAQYVPELEGIEPQQFISASLILDLRGKRWFRSSRLTYHYHDYEETEQGEVVPRRRRYRIEHEDACAITDALREYQEFPRGMCRALVQIRPEETSLLHYSAFEDGGLYT